MRVISGARRRRVAALLLTAFGQVGAFAGALPFYHLDLRIDPPSGSLEVEAQVTLGPQRAGQSVEFLLARPFVILESSPAVEALPFDAQQGFHGINGSSTALAARGEIIRYRVRLAPGEREIRLRYRGQVDFPPDTRTEEYTRGFRETPGLISKEGIYLGGSTLWYPYFDEELLSFELTGEVPQGWHLISQGSGTSRDAQGRAAWRSEGPVDEIDLVGGPLTLYSQPAGAIQAQVFLRTPEEPLARRYLAATAQYLEMYRGLIGPYPYGKFALVENFWETGYGMPSFTLLGSGIIRFPFILASSYPHEILHNWWGNSVFVDYASGNWCEGLTAYLADHLLKEQAGQGLEFRRDALRKYRDFVKDDRDFPLTAFRTRHSAATEAVGYGKTLMLFHMLRRELGDETFRAALARFYREQRGRRASFADLRAVFEKTSGRELGAFFGQWVARTGAPRLALEDLRVEPTGARYRLRGRLVQQQAGAPYVLRVPVYVTTAEGLHIEQISVRSRQADFVIDGLPEPLLVEVDPEFDLFRLLDARETAPSIGQIFGETEILAVLPSRASAESQAAYRRMLEGWRSASHRIEIMSDAALGQLPAGRSVWLLGRENLLAAPLFGTDRSAAVSLSDDSAVVVVRHPTETMKAVGWILIDPPGAAEALARKLPHYGKYSYLGFAGTEAQNTVKGEWAATDSPLRVDLRPGDARARPVEAAARPRRAPLAALPAVFSADALRDHVTWLAAPEREGRGVGTGGLDAAADYLARQFAVAGLAPGGADGSFFQRFRLAAGPGGGPVDLRNVIGVLYPPAGQGAAGKATGSSADVVLITAHYDHLGSGWPQARAGEAGKRHPGADDNASGVAVLLELARIYAAAGAPARPLVFLATTAEEAGLYGARHYLGEPTPFPRERLRAAVNLDTVGRLGAQEIQVLATDSAREWPHLFRGAGFATGIAVKTIAGAAASSDQLAFIERGIPAVQLFAGAHLDYHRPGDTPDRIDVAGMVKVATVTKEAVDYLLGRDAPLTATLAPGGTAEDGSGPQGNARERAAPGERRAFLGTVPDFAFTGSGVRVASVVPGSPAETAGIVAGDVLVAMDGQPIPTLQTYADRLRARAPGAIVSVGVLRGAQRLEKTLTLGVR